MSTHLPATSFAPQHDAIDLAQIGGILRRHVLTIVIFVAIATCLALFHVLFSVPQFTAKGVLYLGDTQSTDNAPAANAASGLNFLSDYSMQSDVETQIELITARALIERAILETGLNTTITHAGAPALTYWRWKLYHGGQTSSFAPGPDTLQALYATTPGKYRLITGANNSYELYTSSGWLRGQKLVLKGVLGKPAAGSGVQMLVEPASDTYQAKPGIAYDLTVISPDALSDSVPAGALTVNSGGSVEQPTKIAFLQFRWNNPYQGQIFVNQVMQDYISTQLSWKTQSASTTEDFVTSQLVHVSALLSQADQNLASYQSKTGIVSVPQSADAVVTQLTQYQTQKTTLELQQKALAQLAQEMNNNADSINPYLVSQTNDTLLSTLTINLSEAEQKLSQLQAQFTDGVPDVQIQMAQVSEIKNAIHTTVQNDLAAANDNLKNLDQTINEFQDRIKSMPAESLKIISLQRSTDVLGQLYILLMEKQEEAQVSKAAAIMNTRIVTPANMPLFATSPKAVITVLFGALIGLITSIIFIFAQRALSGRFESEEQVRLAIHLPVFAAIPRQLKTEPPIGDFGVPTRSPFLESFRLLRRSIYRIATPGKAMVILIISSSKEDGKTTISTNLAKCLADDGKRVVLMDGDLHLSGLQELLKLPSAPGLTDWLATNCRPALKNWPNENFMLLPSGNSRQLSKGSLNEANLASVFETLSSEFDYIIVDSPPLPTVSDGMIFGIFADLILSVVSISHTPRRTLNIHNELIETLGRPHGIIINDVEGQDYGINDAYFFPNSLHPGKFMGWFKRSTG